MCELSSNVGDVFPKVLKLSIEMSECKPLPKGTAYTVDLRRGVQLSPRGFAREAGPCCTAPAMSSTRYSKPGVLSQMVSMPHTARHVIHTSFQTRRVESNGIL
jgi:hypothetical protein